MIEINDVDGLSDEFCFIFDRPSNISYSLFKNVLNKQNTFAINYSISLKSNIFSKIYNRFISKWRINGKKERSKYYNKIAILTNESVAALSDKQLLQIKSKAKALVLFSIDEFFNDYSSIKKTKELLKKENNIFDLVYTFSEKDAKTYSLRVNYAYYSKFDVCKCKNSCDLFFLGNLKNRDAVLTDTAEYFGKNNIGFHFIIAAQRKQKCNKNFDYRLISYRNSIRYVKSANCIFDIVDERQTGMTLRYYEALVYNKKLLTNNHNIVKMPFYDNRYMKIYKTVDDIKNIDLNWFTANEEIDYGYKGEFEPKYFLETISSDLMQK